MATSKIVTAPLIHTPVSKDRFFPSIRKNLFKNRLTVRNVQGMEAIIDEWNDRKLIDTRRLAYMLATTYHETARTMQPIEEGGLGAGRPYGQKLKMSVVRGKRLTYTTPNKIYYGRGFVQLTWYENYELMGRLLGVDLLHYPEKALLLRVATDILFEGMLKAYSSFGDFTGRCLEQYFNERVNDPKGARRVINGQDCAVLISEYHKVFYSALVA